MRGAVDAAGQAGYDRHALLPEIMRQAAGEAAGGGAGVARADDRHHRPVEQAEIALGGEQRRRIVQLGQRRG